jgi:hypothetical protein
MCCAAVMRTTAQDAAIAGHQVPKGRFMTLDIQHTVTQVRALFITTASCAPDPWVFSAVLQHPTPCSEACCPVFDVMHTQDPRWPHHGTDDPFDSTRFNPDRFMTPEGQQQGSQIYFGMGQRTCAGMSLAWAEVGTAIVKPFNFSPPCWKFNYRPCVLNIASVTCSSHSCM